jgi:hypothetical protein
VRAPVLIVANAARYLAQSASAAVLSALVVDAFADRETQRAATCLRQARSVTPQALATAVHDLERTLPRSCSRWVYGAGFEAAPDRLNGWLMRPPV